MDHLTSEEDTSFKDLEFSASARNKKILVKTNSAKSGFFWEERALKMWKMLSYVGTGSLGFVSVQRLNGAQMNQGGQRRTRALPTLLAV